VRLPVRARASVLRRCVRACVRRRDAVLVGGAGRCSHVITVLVLGNKADVRCERRATGGRGGGGHRPR
jgi:hypothetical protein